MSSAAPASSLQTLSDALSNVVAEAAKSVVAVHSAHSRSSGFVWRPGLIVTADEALAEEGDISVVSPTGETTDATLVGRDSTTDIALLRAEGVDAATIPLQSASLRTGALALAVGVRSGAPIAAFGSVSSVGPAWRSLRGGGRGGSSLIFLCVAQAKAASRSTSRAAHSAWRYSGRDDRLWSFRRRPSNGSPANCRPMAGSHTGTLASASRRLSSTAMAESARWS